MKMEYRLVKTYRYIAPDGRELDKDRVWFVRGLNLRGMAKVAGFIAYARRNGVRVVTEWEIVHTSPHMEDAAQRSWESAMCTVPGYEGL